MESMIGGRIREARQAQGRSLADVAAKVSISVATLSRIENDKQSVDLGLFLLLAKALDMAPAELLENRDEENRNGVDPLARRIATMTPQDRADLWRDLAAERRQRPGPRGSEKRGVGQQVEELLAQVEFLREELEAVRRKIKTR